MAYKFQLGDARLSGSLTQEEGITVVAGGLTVSAGTSAMQAVTATTISGSSTLQAGGNATLGGTAGAEHAARGILDLPDHNGSDKGLELAGTLVTSTAAELNLLDTAAAGTVVNSKAVIYSAAGVVQGTDFKGPDGFDIGNASVADFMKFNAAEIIIKDGALDVDIASHDGSNGLKLGGTLVTSNAGELNLLDTAAAGTQVASKAVIYDAQKGVNAHSLTSSFASLGAATGTTISGSGQVSAAGGLYADGTITLNVVDTAIDVSADSLYFRDGDNAMKRDTVADFVSGIAATGLGAGSGQLFLDLNELGDAAVASGDKFAFVDGTDNTSKLESIDDIATLFAGAGLAASSAVLAVANATNGGIGVQANDIKVDLNDLSAAAVDVGNDSIAIIDANDSNATRKESIADLVSGMAGSGLTATDGVLSVDSAGTPQAVVNGTTLTEGFNYLTGALAAAITVSLPGSPSVGDTVHLKAAGGVSATNKITVSTSGSHTVDGSDTVILESAYGAISFVYAKANDWRIW